MSAAPAVEQDQTREAARQRRAQRFARRDQVRLITSLPRLRACGSSSVTGGGVTVGLSARPGGRAAGYGGLATCGSVWCCPQCAAKIATRRGEDLADAIRAVHTAGGSAFLATFTVRHRRRDRLGWSREQRREATRLRERLRERARGVELGDPPDPAADEADHAALAALEVHRGTWDAVTDGWQAANSGRRWQRDKHLHGGLLGWVKAVETTHGRSGWHVHVHVLLAFAADVDEAAVRPLVERMFTRWHGALQRAGYDASGDMGPDGKRPGWDVRRAQVEDNALATYLTKLAHEVTGSHRKEAHRPGGRTPMQLLAETVETYRADDMALWWEWEAASAGRRQLTWSTGDRSLRALAGLGDEQTDEEIAAEELPADDRLGLAPEAWGWVRATGNVTTLLDVAEIEGMSGLRRWLDDHGQAYVTGAGLGWTEQPATAPDRSVPRDRGRGVGHVDSTPAVLRPRDAAGRPLRRPSDRPPRWTADARAVLRPPSRPDVSDRLTIFNDAADI